MSRDDATFFESPAAFRAWFEANYATAAELWVGFHKKGGGTPSIDWPQSVDEALCFGWIDGLRQGIDDTRFRIRFTPRKPTSIWSARNIARVAALSAEGRMTPAGLAAFALRREDRSGVYSFEQRPAEFPAAYREQLDANPAAAAFFDSLPPSYRRVAIYWVVGAKQETTRTRRLATLIELSARGERLPQFVSPKRARNNQEI